MLLAQPGWVLARCWDSSLGECVPHSPTQPRVHLHVQTDHPTACTRPRAAPGHTLPLHALPADTYTSLYTLSLYSPLPFSTVPVHSCPTALPAPQDTPHQCTPHHPTTCVLFSPFSLNHSHACLLSEAGAALPQPLSCSVCAGPGAEGHWGTLTSGQGGHWAEPQHQHWALLQALWENMRDHNGLW